MIILWQSSKMLKKGGVPEGQIIYTDTHLWNKVTVPLFDKELRLTGKPDYIIKKGKQIIPVEVKTGSPNSTPTHSHIYQLAAYCYLIQKTYHQKPAYGILHYETPGERQPTSNRHSYTIKYTDSLENDLLRIISNMRSFEYSDEIPRSHNSVARCYRCSYRHICDQTLNGAG